MPQPTLNLLIRATDNASPIIARLGGQLAGIGVYANGAGKGFNNLTNAQKGTLFAGAALLAGGLGILKFLFDSTKEAANYQAALATLNTVLDWSGSKLNKLGDYMMQLSEKSLFSVSELADAATALARKGITNITDLEHALQAASDLATATGTDLVTAANDIGAITQTFPDMANAFQKAADILTASADSGGQSVDKMTLALKAVGPTAAALHIPFTEISAALATMIARDNDAAGSGTSLYQTIAHLNPVTKAAKEEFKALGLAQLDANGNVIKGTNAFYDQTGKLKPLVEVAEILRDKLGGLSDAQYQTAVQSMFTVRSSKELFALFKGGAGSIEEVTQRMKAQQTAHEKAQKQIDTFNGQLKIFQSSWQDLKIVIGTVFLPVLSKLMQLLTQLINWFVALPKGQQQAIAIFLAIVAVVMTLTGIVMVATVVFTMFGAAISVAVGPILLVIGAVVAVIAIGVALILNWKKISGLATSLWQHGIPDAIHNGLLMAQVVIKTIWNDILGFFSGILQNILTAIFGHNTKAKNAFLEHLQGVFKAYFDAWGKIFAFLGNLFGVIFAAVKLFITSCWAVISTILGAIWKVFSAIFGFIFTVVKVAFTLIWDIIKFIMNVIYWMVIHPILVQIHTAFVAVWAAIQVCLNNFMAFWNQYIGPPLKSAFEVVQTALGKLHDFFSTTFQKVQALVSDACKSIMGFIQPILDMIGKVTGAVSNFGSWAGGLINGASNHIPHFANGGIVSSPTLAMVGEGGESEAIIPLSKLGQMGGGGETHLHLYIDGKQLSDSVDYHLTKKASGQGANRVYSLR